MFLTVKVKLILIEEKIERGESMEKMVSDYDIGMQIARNKKKIIIIRSDISKHLNAFKRHKHVADYFY